MKKALSAAMLLAWAATAAAAGPPMVLIPPGEFLMGSEQAGTDARPVHRVLVSAFYMDTHEVTQKSYEDLLGVDISKFEGSDNPVEQVRWPQAAKYCNARSRAEKLKPCYDETTSACDFFADGYRLPTEAEWEYACRAGTRTAYWFGDEPQRLGSFAWFRSNASKTTHPVATKPANPWHLCDMYGNVAEWCNDFYADDYYRTSPAKDPRGPAQGVKRVIRGGSWNSRPEHCTSASRAGDAPSLPDVCLGYDVYGFRCVRRATETAGK